LNLLIDIIFHIINVHLVLTDRNSFIQVHDSMHHIARKVESVARVEEKLLKRATIE
jgi:hypothetical protein